MSVEAHRCNAAGCKGYIVFENADFDYDHPPVVNGSYEFDDPRCTECGKQYRVVPYHVVISIDEHGDIENVNSACFAEFEKRRKQLEYDAETDPDLRIMNFLTQRGYTYSVSEVIAAYSRYKEEGCYLSYTMKDCVNSLKTELELMLERT